MFDNMECAQICCLECPKICDGCDGYIKHYVYSHVGPYESNCFACAERVDNWWIHSIVNHRFRCLDCGKYVDECDPLGSNYYHLKCAANKSSLLYNVKILTN